MSTALARHLLACAALMAGAAVQAAEYNPHEPILGTWKIFDRVSGTVESLIEFKKQDGKYAGRLVHIYPDNPRTVHDCKKCPPPFRDQPLLGLPIVWNAVPDPNKPNAYINGYALDPKTGKIYQGLGRVSENGRILYLRGYVGASLLGRTENWVRASDKELTEAGLAP